MTFLTSAGRRQVSLEREKRANLIIPEHQDRHKVRRNRSKAGRITFILILLFRGGRLLLTNICGSDLTCFSPQLFSQAKTITPNFTDMKPTTLIFLGCNLKEGAKKQLHHHGVTFICFIVTMYYARTMLFSIRKRFFCFYLFWGFHLLICFSSTKTTWGLPPNSNSPKHWFDSHKDNGWF